MSARDDFLGLPPVRPFGSDAAAILPGRCRVSGVSKVVLRTVIQVLGARFQGLGARGA
jgi:hypothetical protein